MWVERFVRSVLRVLEGRATVHAAAFAINETERAPHAAGG
jgi:hypothetical protein